MGKLSKAALRTVARAAEREVKKGNSAWPPCIGIIHQPKRPEKRDGK